MMDMDPMRDALKRRKSKGVDISISIEPAEPQDKETDLAPKGAPIEGELDPHEATEQQAEGPSEMELLEELVSDMSDHDKQMAMEPGAKPSLGQRARMDALGKLKQQGK